MVLTKNSIKNFPISLLSSFCFISTIFFFGSVNIFLNNWKEISLSLGEVIWYTFFFSLLLSLLLACFIRFLNPIQKILVALLVAASYLTYIQGNFLNPRHVFLDGVSINDKNLAVFGFNNTSIWFLVLFLSIIISSYIFKHARALLNFLLIFQSVSLFITVLTLLSTYSHAKHFLPSEERSFIPSEVSKFQFSRNKNVILIVLDAYQSNIFQELIAEDSDLKSIFDGFTYYPNALAPFNYTRLSIPAILTGNAYKNSIPREQYFRESFLANSIPRVLTQHGFDVELFPWYQHQDGNLAVYADKRIASNFVLKKASSKQKSSDFSKLFNIALIKFLPEVYKDKLNEEQKYFLYGSVVRKFNLTFDVRKLYKEYFSDYLFMRNAQAYSTADASKCTFKFYHLIGAHVPVCVTANCDVNRNLEYSKQTYKGQAKANLMLCKTLISVLKKLDVYDNSMIFIIGDHGSGESEDMYLQPLKDKITRKLDRTASTLNNFERDKTRGCPLMLVKRFNQRGQLGISIAPVSLLDIRKTIFTELNLKIEVPGMSIYDVKENAIRNRYYGAFQFNARADDFEEQITRYVVQGNSWDSHAWAVDSILYPGGSVRNFSKN